MATQSRYPTAANDPTPWFYETYAFTNDWPSGEPPEGMGTWAYHNGTNDNSWMVLSSFGFAIAADQDIVGIEIQTGVEDRRNQAGAKQAIGLDDQTIRLQIALSKDGATPVGTVWTVDVEVNGGHIVLGSPTDLHGASWSPAEINASGLAILYRVPTHLPDEDLTHGVFRSVEYGRLLVYHTTSGGSIMAERETVKQRIHVGSEVTPGTAVPCTMRMMNGLLAPQPQGDWKRHRPAGNKLETHAILQKEWSESDFSGIPTYDEIIYPLASVIGTPPSPIGGVANELNEWTFRFDNRGEQTGQTYTIEYGNDASRFARITKAIFDSFGVEFTRDDAQMSGHLMGAAIEDQPAASMSGGTDEVQTVTVGATGGTFTMEFKGARTAALAFDITSAALETALNALATIGANGVSVTGDGPHVITFDGTAFAGLKQPMFVVDDALATGGSVTIAQTTQGGYWEAPGIPIIGEHVRIYLADTYATLAANKLTRARLSGFSIGERFGRHWVLDGDNLKFLTPELGPSVTFRLQLQADSNGMALLSSGRTGAKKFIRVECIGPDIGATNDPHKFILDACVKVAAFGELSDAEGVYQVNYDLMTTEDTGGAWDESLVATVHNGVDQLY